MCTTERRWVGRSTLHLWPLFQIVSQLARSKLRSSLLSAKDLSDLGFIYLGDYHLNTSSPSPYCYNNYSSWKITLAAAPQGVELLASGDRAHLALVLRGTTQSARASELIACGEWCKWHVFSEQWLWDLCKHWPLAWLSWFFFFFFLRKSVCSEGGCGALLSSRCSQLSTSNHTRSLGL